MQTVDMEEGVEIDPMKPEELMEWVNDNLPYLVGEELRAVGTLAMMVTDYSEFFYGNDEACEQFSRYLLDKYDDVPEGELH